ncbi:MAG: FAD-dependent oxidoreductase [Acidimicrobiales bacterium]
MSARPPIVIIGAGIAGLVAAHELQRHGVDADVYEAGGAVAGMAASHVDPDGFAYDIGAHFVTNRFVGALGVPGPFHTLPRYGEVVHLGPGRFPLYPLGLLGVPRFVASAAGERVRRPERDLRTAAERFRRDYGPALADEVAAPLLAAWSGLPADELSASVIDKIPTSLPRTVWLRAAQRLTRRAVMVGYCKEAPSLAAVHHVVPAAGVAAICTHVADGLRRPVRLHSPAERIHVEDGRVVGARVAGRDIETDVVISTLPINRLADLVSGTDRLERFRRFRFRGLVLVNLKLDGRGLLPDVVVWTPTGFPFFRVTETALSMPWTAPDGKTLVLCELAAQPGDETWNLTDDEATERCVAALERLIPDVRRRLLGSTVLRQALSYPVFALEYEEDRAALAAEGTGVGGLHSIGRNGEFDHILMEDTFWRIRRRTPALLAARAAEQLRPAVGG